MGEGLLGCSDIGQATRWTGSTVNRNSQNRRLLSLEALERRYLLAGDLAQNVTQPLDVDDNDMVTPMDVLVCINAINHPENQAAGERKYLDTNGDGWFTPIDALLIINKLNRGSTKDDPTSMPPRSIDGSDNNLDHPDWGKAGESLLRMSKVAYGDGMKSPSGSDRPGPREVSNAISAQAAPFENTRGMSDMLWQWGQFLDHDIGLTGHQDPVEMFAIEVPPGDPFFDPANEGDHTIDLERSIYDPTSGDSVRNPRQQTNAITAFIDGSNVYGSDTERAEALRTFVDGKLKTSDGNLLPFNEQGLDNAGGTSPTMFLAGDVRANEQVGLMAMHTLWVREHNRLADEVASEDAELTDEQIYQRVRAIVTAEIQAVTYNEFLPALLGPGAISEYSGYDDTINPGIANEFSTATYRLGHSMLSPELLRLDENGDEDAAGNLPLRDAFFSPDEITAHGIDSILRGLAAQRAQEVDAHIVDDVRNFLFGPPGSGGFDLASLNIQRGRDHGLPDFNKLRDSLGLGQVDDFSDVTSDPALQAALEQVYGDIDLVDPWVGALAEDHHASANVGVTIYRSLVDQFQRLRDGDRYWYQRTFQGERLQLIENTSLADIIKRNTNIADLQPNVFFVSGTA